jgi:enoyl-CoA hydratase/carnithine racemase
MEEQLLLTEKKEKVFTLTINRPERRNALNSLMVSQMVDTLSRIREEGEVRCLVIRGAGDKAFCSGYDIADIPTKQTPQQASRSPFQDVLEAVLDFPYPVIAMVNGHAFGAGCDLALTCDVRIGAEHAQMGVPPAKLGIVYGPEGILRFINTVGLANAKEMFFTGRGYAAPKAKEMGLLHYILPADQVASFTYEMAREISENAPLSLKGIKLIFRKCLQYQKLAPEDAREVETLRTQAFNSEDLKEGQRAFKEKRKPVFKGR